MSLAATQSSNTYVPRHVLQPRGKQPWCADCDTDFHLFIDSPVVLNCRTSTIAVAVYCSQCSRSRVLETTAELVATLRCLNPTPFEPQGIPQT